MRYVPGRLYEKEKRTRKGYLREERVENVPVSFKKLNSFLKERRRDIKHFVQETTEEEAGIPDSLQCRPLLKWTLHFCQFSQLVKNVCALTFHIQLLYIVSYAWPSFSLVIWTIKLYGQ